MTLTYLASTIEVNAGLLVICDSYLGCFSFSLFMAGRCCLVIVKGSCAALYATTFAVVTLGSHQPRCSGVNKLMFDKFPTFKTKFEDTKQGEENACMDRGVYTVIARP